MTLTLVVSLLLADSFMSPERPVAVSRKRAVAVLTSPRSSWEQRYGAFDALHKQTLTTVERDALLKALPALSHRSAGPCDETRTPSCDATYGPCLSAYGFVLAAVNETNVADAFVDAALETVKPGVDPNALPLARRILARAKHESTEALGLSLLEGSYSCVDEGAWLLSRVPQLSDAARVVLERTVRSGGENQRAVGGLIANRSEPWARALKLETLASPDTGLRLGAVRYAWVKGADPELLQAMAQVAWCDPSLRLQTELRGRFIASNVALPDAGCARPSTPWMVEGHTVHSRDGGVVAQLANESVLGPASEACATWAKRYDETKPLGTLDSHCVVALNLGEWGGGLYDFPLPDGGAELVVRNSFLHPRAVVKRGAELLVLSSSNRYGFGNGGFGRLTSDDAGLHYEPVMSWNGSPIAWATTNDTLLVTFPASDFMAPCPFSDTAREVTYRFTTDGGWSMVPGDATKCLWP